ncbi:hypothetical protein [Anaerovorax sp. IOR16]|uniref:hypothetical protein n=1 Tax=Anaerovorax sp. IOR16 TaxID=2773458 RepID=UPI0019D009EC|nr:hypothetical protein [Anaerovorax sp. IOR16]
MIQLNITASVEYMPEPEYKVENNCLYRKLIGDEIVYYLDELQRLHIAESAIWLELSSCQDKWIEKKKKELKNSYNKLTKL